MFYFYFYKLNYYHDRIAFKFHVVSYFEENCLLLARMVYIVHRRLTGVLSIADGRQGVDKVIRLNGNEKQFIWDAHNQNELHWYNSSIN